MWKKLVSALARIGLLTLVPMAMAVGSAQGQSLSYKIQATIPFDFMVGDNKLSAGEYFIGRARPGSDDSVLTISSRNSLTNIFSSTIAVQALEPNRHGKLIFQRHGDQWFLFQIWPAGINTGREITSSRLEREIERKAHVAEETMGARSTIIHLQ
jgi:hypothetical protein